MKKITLAIIGSFFLLLAAISFFLNTSSIDQAYFYMEDGSLYRYANESSQAFSPYGINVNGGLPGVFPGEDKVSVKTYLTWFEDISRLGMNSVRVTDLMSENFYKAVLEFNEQEGQAIYVLQGIAFDEVALKYGVDPLSRESREDFKEKAESVINSVHGNPGSFIHLPFFDSYVTDVSEYIIGYSLGPEWQSHDVIYGELMNDPLQYQGRYFTSTEEASAFEAFIAEILDHVVDYTYERYGRQPIVSFQGSTGLFKEDLVLSTDGRMLSLESKTDFGISSIVDGEHIVPTPALRSGYFVSYNIYSDETGPESDYENIYQEITAYHTVPVLISEYGYPSTRLATNFVKDKRVPYLSEEDQADRIIRSLDQIEATDILGSFLMEYHDSWFKSTWNTVDRKILDSAAYWSDAQTSTQAFGIIAYDPVYEGRSFHMDGNHDEWEAEDLLRTNDTYSLSVSMDSKYLYLLVESHEANNLLTSQLVIDFDITPKSGAYQSPYFDMAYARPVDFLVLISNQEARVLVHDYYDTYRFEKSIPALKVRPDLIPVRKNTNGFSDILIDVEPGYVKEIYDHAIGEGTLITGQLYSGNTNPASDDFTSYADYYMNPNRLELRLPWALLNFMDPSNQMIHDDYYDSFKIKPLHIEEIYIGLTVGDSMNQVVRLESSSLDLKTWSKPKYKKRYKRAYEKLRDRQ